MKKSFDILVDPKFRSKAGIPKDNPFINSIMGNEKKYSYIKSCDVIQKYADNCDAKIQNR